MKKFKHKKRKSVSFFKKLNQKHLYILLVLIGIFLEWYLFMHLDKVHYLKKAEAESRGAPQDTCKLVKLNYVENVNCNSLINQSSSTCAVLNPNIKNNISQYTWTINLSSQDNKTHTVTYHAGTHFCNAGYKTYDSGSGFCTCGDRTNTQDLTVTVPATGTKAIIFQYPNPFGKVCGTWQYDYRITSIDGNTNCNQGKFLASGSCETGTACTGPISTPTPVQPTPTPVPPMPTLPFFPGATATPVPVGSGTIPQRSCPSGWYYVRHSPPN